MTVSRGEAEQGDVRDSRSGPGQGGGWGSTIGVWAGRHSAQGEGVSWGSRKQTVLMGQIASRGQVLGDMLSRLWNPREEVLLRQLEPEGDGLDIWQSAA